MAVSLNELEQKIQNFIDGNISPMNLAQILQIASVCFENNLISLRQYRIIIFNVALCIDGDFTIEQLHKYGEIMKSSLP